MISGDIIINECCSSFSHDDDDSSDPPSNSSSGFKSNDTQTARHYSQVDLNLATSCSSSLSSRYLKPAVAGYLATVENSHSTTTTAPGHRYNDGIPTNLMSTNQHYGGEIAKSWFLDHPSADQLSDLCNSCNQVLLAPDGVVAANSNRDFNSEYQDLYDWVPSNLLDAEQREKKLRHVERDFESFSRSIAEVIILQLQLGKANYLIPAIDAGGIAGGEKFLFGKVLFKLAWDWQGVYGSDIAASKAAFAEIRSLQCIIKAQIPGLHVPLMGVFRLHGHTIIASAIAPIGKMNRTLIYGSDDAGQSFVNRRASAIEPVAKSLCQKLGLATHQVQVDPKYQSPLAGQCMSITGPIDQEIHFSATDSFSAGDRRLYIVDLARLMPSMPPCSNERGSEVHTRYLTHLFRPEAIRLFNEKQVQMCLPPILFSSDVFSPFVSGTPDQSEHEANARTLMSFVLDEQVPALGKSLVALIQSLLRPNVGWLDFQVIETWQKACNRATEFASSHPSRLSTIMHDHGVNMRYLGAVWLHLSKCSHDFDHNGESWSIAMCLLTHEMLSRVRKNQSIQQCTRQFSGAHFHELTCSTQGATIASCRKCQSSLQSEEHCESDSATMKASKASSHMMQLCLQTYFNTDHLQWNEIIEHPSWSQFFESESFVLQPDLKMDKSAVITAEFFGMEQMLDRIQAEISLIDNLEPDNVLASIHSRTILLKVIQEWFDSTISRNVLIEQGMEVSRAIIFRVRAVCNSFSKVNSAEILTEVCSGLLKAQRFLADWMNPNSSSFINEIQICHELIENLRTKPQVLTASTTTCIDDASGSHLSETSKKLNHAPSDHPDIATSLTNIGNAYGVLGDASKQLEYMQRGLCIRERVLPADHPDIATSINYVGNAYGALGQASKQLEYLQRALSIDERILPPDHPDIATSLSHIGNAYGSLGEPAKQLDHLQRALSIFEHVLPADHPKIASTLSNVGNTYGTLGQVSKQLEYMQRALSIDERVLPADHPNIATSLCRIGYAYAGLGETSKQLEYFQRALSIFERVLPADHPDIAALLSNIGNVYGTLGQASKRLEYLQRSLSIFERVLPADHPNMAAILGQVGNAYGALGDTSKRLEYLHLALSIRERVLPADHPHISVSLSHIGDAYGALGERAKQLEYLQRALSIREKVLPADHPHIANTICQIGDAFGALGETAKQLECLQRALSIRERVLPAGHPDIASLQQAIEQLAIV